MTSHKILIKSSVNISHRISGLQVKTFNHKINVPVSQTGITISVFTLITVKVSGSVFFLSTRWTRSINSKRIWRIMLFILKNKMRFG